jgi:REP element-mobilizing transposase RayT
MTQEHISVPAGAVVSAVVSAGVAQPPSAVSSVVSGPIAKPSTPKYYRNLPHIQAAGRPVFFTFRTCDHFILPESVRSAVLAHCLHDNQVKCYVHAAVVMPDHVHMILTPLCDPDDVNYGFAEIVGGIKGASAHTINRMLKRKGNLWQDESFDQILRGDEEIDRKCDYIVQNPVRKGLAAAPDGYPWIWRDWVEGQKQQEQQQPRIQQDTAEGGCATPTTAATTTASSS